jgi:hypothetical protein
LATSEEVIEVHRCLLPALLLIMVLGCNDLGSDESGSVVLVTDKAAYQIGETVVYNVRNEGGATAYLWHCNHRLGYWVQEQENGLWGDVDERYMLCLAIYASGGEAILVDHSNSDTLTFSVPGEYRLKMGVGWK